MTRSAQSTRSTQVRRNRLIIGGVVALALIASLMAVLVMTRPSQAGAVDPSPTPTPVPSVPATPEPTEDPIPTPEPSEAPVETPTPVAPAPTEEPGSTPVVQSPDGVLPPGSLVRVVVESIKMRGGPTTESQFLGTIDQGDLVVVNSTLRGPVEAEGFVWYPVIDLDTTDLSEVTGRRQQLGYLGWMVVGNGTEDFVEPVAPRCPTGDPDLAALDKMLEWEHLACFGDRSITVEGTFGCPLCDGVMVGSYEPAWLASPLNFNYLSVDLKVQEGPFTLHFGPNGPAAPERGSIIRVTGHFDDAAAAECVIKAGVEEIRIDSVVENLHCRSQFVVESYDVIGFDEDFPMS